MSTKSVTLIIFAACFSLYTTESLALCFADCQGKFTTCRTEATRKYENCNKGCNAIKDKGNQNLCFDKCALKDNARVAKCNNDNVICFNNCHGKP